ncbi:MAG: hypothetical protein ACKO7W_04330 [Elainella sp.]
MSFLKLDGFVGAAITAAVCLSASAGMALPSSQTNSLISQANVPSEEGVPQLGTEEVRGRITKIDGDQVTIRTSSGETKTYEISASEQESNQLTVGSEVLLTVRGDSVVAIGSSSTTGTASSSERSGSSSSSSSSSSSTTVIRRQTTVQQTQPAPRPAPAPAPAPAAQPVRGLW